MNRLSLVLAILLFKAGFAMAEDATPTFASEVAAIVHEKCTVCHRPNSSGPFDLITYDDVRRRAGTIQAVIDAGYMPPWKPVDHGTKFANARNLTEDQQQTLQRWIDADCPPGELRKAPSPPNSLTAGRLGSPT